MGAKRSVQCYPCAEKFVPPPRPETLEEKCDRIASELQVVRAELARTKRNHLRNQLRRADLAANAHAYVARQGGMSSSPQIPKRLRRAARNRDRWRKVADAIRAALERKE